MLEQFIPACGTARGFYPAISFNSRAITNTRLVHVTGIITEYNNCIRIRYAFEINKNRKSVELLLREYSMDEHVAATVQLPASSGPPFLQSAIPLTTVTTFIIY